MSALIRDGGAVAYDHHRRLDERYCLLGAIRALGDHLARTDHNRAPWLHHPAPRHETFSRRRIEQIDLELDGQHSRIRRHQAQRA